MVVTGDRDAYQLVERRRADHDDLARDHRHEGLRPPGRDRPLRHPARADPGLHRPQGRHVGQHPRRPGHRRQDGRRAAAALRRRSRTCSAQRRRDLGRQAQARTSPSTPTTRAISKQLATIVRDVAGRARPGAASSRASPTARACARCSASSSCATRCGGWRRRSRTPTRPASRGRDARPRARWPSARGGAVADLPRLPGRGARARRGRAPEVPEGELFAARASAGASAPTAGEAVRSPARSTTRRELVAAARRPAGDRPRRQGARARCRPTSPSTRWSPPTCSTRRGAATRSTSCARSAGWPSRREDPLAARARARPRARRPRSASSSRERGLEHAAATRSSCRSCACCARWRWRACKLDTRAAGRRSRCASGPTSPRSSARSGTWPARSS